MACSMLCFISGSDLSECRCTSMVAQRRQGRDMALRTWTRASRRAPMRLVSPAITSSCVLASCACSMRDADISLGDQDKQCRLPARAAAPAGGSQSGSILSAGSPVYTEMTVGTWSVSRTAHLQEIDLGQRLARLHCLCLPLVLERCSLCLHALEVRLRTPGMIFPRRMRSLCSHPHVTLTICSRRSILSSLPRTPHVITLLGETGPRGLGDADHQIARRI